MKSWLKSVFLFLFIMSIVCLFRVFLKNLSDSEASWMFTGKEQEAVIMLITIFSIIVIMVIDIINTLLLSNLLLNLDKTSPLPMENISSHYSLEFFTEMIPQCIVDSLDVVGIVLLIIIPALAYNLFFPCPLIILLLFSLISFQLLTSCLLVLQWSDYQRLSGQNNWTIYLAKEPKMSQNDGLKNNGPENRIDNGHMKPFPSRCSATTDEMC